MRNIISNEIPVVIGEFGARDKNGNLQSRVDYAAYYIAAARAYGMSCNWWITMRLPGTANCSDSSTGKQLPGDIQRSWMH